MRQVHDDENVEPAPSETTVADRTVLEYVAHSDMYRNRLVRELAGLWRSLIMGTKEGTDNMHSDY